MYRCGKHLYVGQYVQVWETLVCRTVCTGVGQHLYIGQYVQVWGNTCI